MTTFGSIFASLLTRSTPDSLNPRLPGEASPDAATGGIAAPRASFARC